MFKSDFVPPLPPKMIAVEDGDIINIFPFQSWLEVFQDVVAEEELIPLCKTASSKYREEAIIYEYLAATGKQRSDVDGYDVGLRAGLPLRRLRDHYWSNWAGKTAVPEAVARILWGAPATSGSPLYAAAASLLRGGDLEAHVESRPDIYKGLDAGELVMDWAKASGVTHPRALQGVCHVIFNYFLTRRPRKTFADLDGSEMEFARGVAGSDPRLAFAFFRCLQRVSAWSYRGQVAWRSSWLRGSKTNPDAIPGASTYSARLKELLDEHLFVRVKGHSARRSAAHYRLRRPLAKGICGARAFAKKVDLELDDNETPKRK